MTVIRAHKDIDGIVVFDENSPEGFSDYEESSLDNLYRLEQKHFWFISRKEFLFGRFQKYIDKQSRIIEIGAGTGDMARYFKANGYQNIAVGEIHKKGLEYARSYGIKGLYQFDLRNPPFKEEFDGVAIFDVLEHIANEDLVLQNVKGMLRDAPGKIVLTVPAHSWLWSRADTRARHKRRYNKKDLKELLEKNGFEIIEMKYFFMSIVPVLLLRRLLNPDKRGEGPKKFTEAKAIHPGINKILLCLCRLENRFIDGLPNLFGGSLYAIARKS